MSNSAFMLFKTSFVYVRMCIRFKGLDKYKAFKYSESKISVHFKVVVTDNQIEFECIILNLTHLQYFISIKFIF